LDEHFFFFNKEHVSFSDCLRLCSFHCSLYPSFTSCLGLALMLILCKLRRRVSVFIYMWKLYSTLRNSYHGKFRGRFRSLEKEGEREKKRERERKKQGRFICHVPRLVPSNILLANIFWFRNLRLLTATAAVKWKFNDARNLLCVNIDRLFVDMK